MRSSACWASRVVSIVSLPAASACPLAARGGTLAPFRIYQRPLLYHKAGGAVFSVETPRATQQQCPPGPTMHQTCWSQHGLAVWLHLSLIRSLQAPSACRLWADGRLPRQAGRAVPLQAGALGWSGHPASTTGAVALESIMLANDCAMTAHAPGSRGEVELSGHAQACRLAWSMAWLLLPVRAARGSDFWQPWGHRHILTAARKVQGLPCTPSKHAGHAKMAVPHDWSRSSILPICIRAFTS